MRPQLSIKDQVLSQAPDNAHGYRLWVPPGSRGGRPALVPRNEKEELLCWTLEPFEFPRQVGEGRYEIQYVTEEGEEIERPSGTAPAVVNVWWISLDESAEGIAATKAKEVEAEQDTVRVGELRQKLQAAEAELDRRKAEVEHLTSESNALAQMRSLVAQSAEREMQTAEKAVETARKAAEQASTLVNAGMTLLGLVNSKIEALQNPPPPPPPIDWSQSLNQTIKTIGEISVAVIQREPGKARQALESAGALPAGTAAANQPAASQPAGQPAAGEPPVVEVPTPAPPGTEAFADLIKDLSEQEREDLIAGLKDPERRKEFMDKIRGKAAPGTAAAGGVS